LTTNIKFFYGEKFHEFQISESLKYQMLTVKLYINCT